MISLRGAVSHFLPENKSEIYDKTPGNSECKGAEEVACVMTNIFETSKTSSYLGELNFRIN